VCRFVLLHEIGRNPTTVADLDALAPQPLPDVLRVTSSRACAVLRATCHGGGADRRCRRDVLLKRCPELLLILPAQVDLVLPAIEAELDGCRILGAVQVVEDFDRRFLGHWSNRSLGIVSVMMVPDCQLVEQATPWRTRAVVYKLRSLRAEALRLSDGKYHCSQIAEADWRL